MASENTSGSEMPAGKHSAGTSNAIRFGVLAAIAAIAGSGSVVGYQYYSEAKKDGDAFALAKAGGTQEHFLAYVRQFPQGRHVEAANRAVDDAVWRDTPKTEGGLSSYVQRFPNGQYVAEARGKLDELAWAQASSRGDLVGLDNYLQKFPAGRYAVEAEQKLAGKLACNRQYAQNELSRLNGSSDLVAAGSQGANNVYSTKQGAAYSNTYFNGNTATTYHHDGSYQSQDGIRVNYRVRNNSLFLVYREVDGTVSFRTKAGAFWRGALGGWIGAAAGAAKTGDATQGAKEGAKKGYDMAQHSERVTITTPIGPGESYNGSAFLSAKYKVLNSEFKVAGIRAEVSESLLRRKIAPGC